MKAKILNLIVTLVLTLPALAQVTPGAPNTNGLTPVTATFDVNTNQNNTATESTGVSIASNGNVIIGWEDDSTTDADIFYWGAAWALFDSAGNQLNPVTTITNYNGSQTINTFYRAYFRANGTPTPANIAWGPKIKANRFGGGMGMGATAYALGVEVPEFAAINMDAGGGGDFPAVQLVNNDGTPVGIATLADADAEPTGDIRIGDWDYLANGNIVIVGESRQEADLVSKFGGSIPRRHVAYKIVTPSGVEVKPWTLASASAEDRCEMWHGVGVTANGFAIRFSVTAGASPVGVTVRIFDNAGTPTSTNLHLVTLTGNANAGGGGRGDGAGFHGNGANAYVHIATGGGTPVITVLNTDGTLKWSRTVADTNSPAPASDRVDAAMAPDGRVIAVWDDTSAGALRLPQGRMFGPSGEPLGGIFWISERDQPAPGGSASFATRRPRVDWRGDSIAIIWESLNSAATFSRVVSGRLFTANLASAESAGLTPRTPTLDVNTNQNNTATESTGVSIAANGNVIVGWEDDSTTDADIFYWGAAWALFNTNGVQLNPVATITNYNGTQSINTFYRSYFRANGTPTPANTAWGPKIKASRFGNGMGMGATAYALGLEVPELGPVNMDAGGGGDFPAVQLLNNDGTPIGIATVADADAEPTGDIRIGDWDYLANGNIVIVGESRQEADLVSKFGGSTPRRHVAYRIVTPAGVQVKPWTLASTSAEDRCEMWHGVGVTANGFAIRFSVTTGASPVGVNVRMFDNAGNPTSTNLHLVTLTGNPSAGGGGRGDGAGFHGNGTDAYVHAASGAGGPWITVLNANGTLRWSRSAADEFEILNSDRVDAAIAADGRVVVVFDETMTDPLRFPQARLFSASGVPIGSRFWVSERDQPAPTGTATAASRVPRVDWRGNTIAFTWQSMSSPATFNRVVSLRLFDVSASSVLPSILASISKQGANVNLTWIGGGPTWSVTRRSTILGPATIVATNLVAPTFSEPRTGDQGYYRITSP